MERVRFDEIKIGTKFIDYFYSGDWCIKIGNDIARPVESGSPMCYSIGPDSIVLIEQNNEEKPLASAVINDEDDDDSPYCECGNEPMEDESASNKCDACGKPLD